MSNDKLTELKPCPHHALGGPHNLGVGKFEGWWKVFCGCGAMGPGNFTPQDATADWNRRTPAETVSRDVVWEYLVSNSGTICQLVSNLQWGSLADLLLKIRLPAPLPVSTGAVSNAVDFDGVVRCVCGARPVVRHVTHGQFPSMDDYWQVGCHHPEAGVVVLVQGDTKQSVAEEWNRLASRTPVPAPVSVPGVDSLEMVIAEELQDLGINHRHRIATAIHDYLLTRQPDLTAVVEALESISRIENGVESDMKRVDMCVRIARKALATIKGEE